MRAAIASTGLVLLLAALLTACTEPDNSTAPTLPPSSSPAPTSDGHTDDDEHMHGPTDAPTPATPDVQADTIATANEIMTIYARPDLEQAEWFSALQPFLTEHAATAYVYVVPANIEPSAVLPGAATEGAPNDLYAVVTVPTNAGPWRVELTRIDPSDPWLAERIQPID